MTTPTPHGQVPASSAVLKAIREANMQLVRTGDDAFMLVTLKQPAPQQDDLDAITLIAECRDAFPTPEHGSPIENEWMAACSDPSEVPGYMRAIAGRMAQPSPQQDVSAAGGDSFLLLPTRPAPCAPANTAGLSWDAYSGAQMLAYGRSCSDAALVVAEPQPSPAAQGDALSDDAVRVPLDSLHADAAYLIGRLREGSMPYARVIEIIRERIDAAKAAIRARAAQEGKSHDK